MANIELLKSKIEESGMTITAICKKTGILRATLYNRFNDGNFNVSEVQALSKVLRLSDSEKLEIFLP